MLAFAAALSKHAQAQTCPAYPPELRYTGFEAARGVHFVGLSSGCTDTTQNCALGGEAIKFTAVERAPGRPPQSCDVVTWDFGDGTKVVGDLPQHQFVVTSWQQHRFAITIKIENALGAVTTSSSVDFLIPPCNRTSFTTTALASFVGQLTMCNQFGGKCAIGEKIVFTPRLIDPQAQPCDQWQVTWGDGTRTETFKVDSAYADGAGIAHYFSTSGSFNVSFQILSSSPPPPTKTGGLASALSATVIVAVTDTGETPIRHRTSRH